MAAWRATYKGLIDDAALDDRTVDKRMTQWKDVIEGRAWPDHVVHVVEVDGVVKGFSQVGPSDDDDAHLEPTVHVYSLYLDPTETGRGLGSALLDYVLEGAARRGSTLATLYVLVGNDAARRFYAARGWEPEPEVVTDCLGDGTEAPQLRYRKRLSVSKAATS